jgi:hypothetical protein
MEINEDLLSPLITEHLLTSRSVASLILDAISLRNRVKYEMSKIKESHLYVAKIEHGRVYQHEVIGLPNIPHAIELEEE